MKGVLTMSSAQEKLNKWLPRAFRGEEGFLLLSHDKDGWVLQVEDKRERIKSLAGGIWSDNQMHISWKSDGNTSIDDSVFCVVKDNSKMMVAVKGVGIFSFGTKDDNTENCRAFFLVRCDWLTTLIAATSDPSMVLVQHYIQDGSDPLAVVLTELFDNLAGNSSRKGVAEDAGETRPSDSVDLGTGAAIRAATQA